MRKKGKENNKAQTRTILKVEKRQAINRLTLGIVIGAIGVLVVYSLLVWILK